MKNYLSGVKTCSHILNFNIEAFSSSELKLTLRGPNNCNKHVPRSKLPLLPVHLMKIVQLLDIYDLLDACLWSFMTMAFFGKLRASNLISCTPSCFNPTDQLIRRCVILQKKVCCFVFSGPKLDKFMTISTSYPFVGLLNHFCAQLRLIATAFPLSQAEVMILFLRCL